MTQGGRTNKDNELVATIYGMEPTDSQTSLPEFHVSESEIQVTGAKGKEAGLNSPGVETFWNSFTDFEFRKILICLKCRI